MATSTTTTPHVPLRPSLSCTRCTQRKVKCDRARPSCNACAKHDIACHYLPEAPPRKRTKRRITDLTRQIKHYEALLQQRTNDIDEAGPVSIPQKPLDQLDSSFDDAPGDESVNCNAETSASTINTAQARAKSKAISEENRLVERLNKTQVLSSEGRSKFVDNDLWYRVVEEFRTPEDALEEPSDAENDDLDISENDNNSLVLSTGVQSKTSLRHPPPAEAQRLFDIFSENVDPLTKIVHVPTLRTAFRNAISATHGIPRGFEALMFAIYSAAVMSMKEDDCQTIFRTSRKALFRQYTNTTRRALSRANFMSTISFVVLQALFIYIIAIRNTFEPRAVWTLTGVAIRIAQGMGIDRDGSQLKLPVFESEIRRRLWWLLQTHDWRCAELCGLAKFRNMENLQDAPQWPSNLDDNQIRPLMATLPSPERRITDMSFMCIRSELVKFASRRIARLKQSGRDANLVGVLGLLGHKEEVEKACHELQEVFETKYIRYCDPSQPMHVMIMVLARYAINVTRFLMNHPRQWEDVEKVPRKERQYVWELSISLLEQHTMVLSNPLLKNFSWHAPFFVQWHGLIHTLDVLRADPGAAEAEAAWRLIAKLYDHNDALTLDMRKPIHAAVGGLCLKAYAARESYVKATTTGNSFTMPTFIVQLKEALERVRAKTLARQNKPARKEDQLAPSDQSLSTNNATSRSDPSSTNLQPTSGSVDSESGYWWEDGILGCNDGFEFPDVMDLDSTLMFARDDLDASQSAGAHIDWARWDAWLADSNTMAPYLSPDSNQSNKS